MAQQVPVRSYARIRSAPPDDRGKSPIKFSLDKVTVDTSGSGTQTFSCDRVFGSDVSTETVYKETCEVLVAKMIEGINVAIMAIGSTGSGKSYFLQGSESEMGLVSHMCKGLLDSALKLLKNKMFLTTVSFVEIMDDHMVDLLNPHGKEMSITRHPQVGDIVDGLSELVVNSASEVIQLYEQGCRARRLHASDVRAHRERAHALFFITVEQRESANAKLTLRSRLTIADLAGIESTACGPVMDVVEALGNAKKKSAAVPYSASLITRALQDALGGNCVTALIAIIVPSDPNVAKSLSCLQDARNIKNRAETNVNDRDRVIADLRDSIANMRDQIAKKNASKEDARTLQELVKQLQVAKQQTWEAKLKLSATYEQERRTNLANKGLLEWVMESRKKGSAEAQQKILELQKEKDQANQEYKEKRQSVDTLKEDLQKKIEEYAKLSEAGKGAEPEGRALVTAIHTLKERLQQQNESLKNAKLRIADLSDRLSREKEGVSGGAASGAGSTGDAMLAGSVDMRRAVEKEERERLEAEHRAAVHEQLERVKFDLEQEKADIQMRVSEGKKYSSEDCIELETTIAQMKGEKAVMTLQLEVLQKEKDRLVHIVDEAFTQHKADLEVQRLRTFQVFRDYRDMFEKQKAVLEQRYKHLLEDAIQDAVYLSSRNSEIQQENLTLKQQVAELKDKITRSGV